MVTRICLLLEVLSAIICLHCLYGEKIKLDIATVSFLGIDMIIMEFINHYELAKTCTMVIYPIIIIYCGVRFGFNTRILIINSLICITMLGVTQLMAAFLVYIVLNESYFADMQLLIVNLCAFLIMILVVKRIKSKKILFYLQQKGKVLILTIGVGITVILFCLLTYKTMNRLLACEYILLFLVIVFMFFLGAQVEKYKLKSKEIATELKMHKLYESSFNNLIENIRLRQHEFDNHINTILSQQYMYNTYEELVNAQNAYSNLIIKDNRYSKLLRAKNPIVAGFLYGKFIEIEKRGIEVTYTISINNLEIKMPVYKIIEILGDLINNAVEALTVNGGIKKLHVSIIEAEEILELEVRNTSEIIDREEMHKFYNKGYSKKGENRGLGLYNVKKICEEYAYAVGCCNKKIDNENWLSFVVTNREEYVKANSK